MNSLNRGGSGWEEESRDDSYLLEKAKSPRESKGGMSAQRETEAPEGHEA